MDLGWHEARIVSESRRHYFPGVPLKAQLSGVKNELQAEVERATRTVLDLSLERDRLREALSVAQTSLGSVEGALGEARKRIEEQDARNRELSERVIAEAAKAQALGERVKVLEKKLCGEL